ncbi:YifB family Mg chelatase-like AAA ATPase [Canibacter sp. lx-45]|uniref:YifB family Mg chelatase-like AAA ATPase n=1 Tax=Canibacter zhuwentaonis TaxID=2837491 RepID=UPI001BDD9EB3|nr:YifB family Mg chelatase-like AAA ATPase [Canibacter zhuwentaonis]MBT1034828.1 YifB family Mg chelatase-like AAA ATPase [Canibacter zhuwentaonis]
MTEIARTKAIALTGITGDVVTVEAAVSSQLPGMVIIGLPDTALTEAKQRVRLACIQAKHELSNRFITVNLSPAALPKQGSGFDLAIALSAMAVSGHIPNPQKFDCAYIGELGLDGSVRRSSGLLTAVIAAKKHGFKVVMVAEEAAQEARLVADIKVIAVVNLQAAVAWHRAESGQWREVSQESSTRAAESIKQPDLKDIIGQEEAKAALEIAAAGGHHMLMVGPPGAGKTLLASCLPSILPVLDDAAALETSSVQSLQDASMTGLTRTAPFIAPHHTATAAAIIGNADRNGVRPGAVTKANNGVLFLDEAAEFAPRVLNTLRQPLESGEIQINRARAQVIMPAKFQLVLATNPCPCGYAKSNDLKNMCECTAVMRRKYLLRISGPLRDRIDIHLLLNRVRSTAQAAGGKAEDSQTVRERVIKARLIQRERYKNTVWQCNSQVSGAWFRAPENALPRAVTAVLDSALLHGEISLRSYDRILRVAWTLADLAGAQAPMREHIAKALTMRAGQL